MATIAPDIQRTIAAIRFGYGLSPSLPAPRGPDELMQELRTGADAGLLFDRPSLPARLQLQRDRQLARKEATGGDLEKRLTAKMSRMLRQDVGDILAQRAFGEGMFERMSAFWADHFTISTKSGVSNPIAPTYEHDTIRPHVMGTFTDMLLSVSKSPVMLEYLDQRTSFGPNSIMGKRRGRGLNENLAREMLELHTMGVGADYTQQDVRELARLLTGYSWDRKTGDFIYRAGIAEPGEKRILGKTYGGRKPDMGDAEAFLRDLARHPATLRHIATKLAVHFVAPDPDPGLIDHLTEVMRRSNGHLPTVYAALLDHDDAWQPAGQKVKNAAHYLASAARAMGLRTDRLELKEQRRIVNALHRQNQLPWRPAGPDGWAEDETVWINPPNLAVRLEIASKLGHLLADRPLLDPRQMAVDVLGTALKPATAFAIGAAEDRWEGFALMFASAEFNRR